MNVLVTCEHRFERTPDGRVWTDGPFAYRFWTRYLDVFESLSVLARVREVETASNGAQPADGVKVAFLDVPDYSGPEQYLRRAVAVEKVARKAVYSAEAVILRVPGQMGRCLDGKLRARGHPYAVEVVGDPYDVFAPGAVRHPLRRVFRWVFTRRLRTQCAGAAAAAYVTECALQRRYPPGPHTYASHYSDVELPDGAFVRQPRSAPVAAVGRLVYVGTLSQLYKAPDVLLEAVAASLRRGRRLELTLVGSGRDQPELERQAAALGLGECVRFAGQLATPEAVRAELDRADLFVLPSRVEGLPRALIEAMARGMPCIATAVGGIPELLPGEDLVRAGDAEALSARICEVLCNSARYEAMAARNLEKAREFRPGALVGRRELFYRCVRDRTETWLLQEGWR